MKRKNIAAFMQEYGVGQFWGKLREEVLVGGHESYIAKSFM